MKTCFFVLTLLLLSLDSQAATWNSKKFQDMNYQIYVPEASASGKRSLMLSLHGCAQKSEDLAQHGNWEQAAAQHSTVVVLPQVPMGGAMMGCWNYYGSDQSAQNKDNAILLQFLNELLKDKNLNIDPRRVYVTGLSSGGGQALLMGCLHPDLFAGMGLNSSPVIPSEAQDISRPQTTADQMAQFCEKLADSHSSSFRTQMISVIVADQDFIVAPEHSRIIVEGLKSLLNLESETDFDLSQLEGNNKKGEGHLFNNDKGLPRLSFIINQGMGHNWPAGGGQPGGSFITQNSINYPMYVLDFFENSNPRISRPKAPSDF